MKKLSRSAVAAATVGLVTLATSAANAGGHDYGHVAYPFAIVSGGEITENSHEGWTGLFYAFNRDLTQSGFILRVLGTTGSYDYTDGFTTFDSDYFQGDVMIGYQIVRGGIDVAAYIGVDYQDYDITPDDPLNEVRGDEVGFKVAVDLESNGASEGPLYVMASGSYSTAFNSYYALGRIGYDFGRLTIGPEVWALGDDSYDAYRIGGFVNIDLPLRTGVYSALTISAGYQTVDDDDNGLVGYYSRGKQNEDGAYATIKFTTAFGEHQSHTPLK